MTFIAPQFLFLDYYLGKCHLQYKDLKLRKLRLYDGKEALVSFLSTIGRLKLLHESEANRLNGRV